MGENKAILPIPRFAGSLVSELNTDGYEQFTDTCKQGGENTGNASSTFIIRQLNTTVTATYYGRNEKINNHTDSVTDNVRNTVMAPGAMAGLSEIQWFALIHAFLK